MSKQLALSIVVSVLAMVSFVLLGQEAGAQLARDAQLQVPLRAGISPFSDSFHLPPILN